QAFLPAGRPQGRLGQPVAARRLAHAQRRRGGPVAELAGRRGQAGQPRTGHLPGLNDAAKRAREGITMRAQDDGVETARRSWPGLVARALLRTRWGLGALALRASLFLAPGLAGLSLHDLAQDPPGELLRLGRSLSADALVTIALSWTTLRAALLTVL